MCLRGSTSGQRGLCTAGCCLARRHKDQFCGQDGRCCCSWSPLGSTSKADPPTPSPAAWLACGQTQFFSWGGSCTLGRGFWGGPRPWRRRGDPELRQWGGGWGGACRCPPPVWGWAGEERHAFWSANRGVVEAGAWSALPPARVLLLALAHCSGRFPCLGVGPQRFPPRAGGLRRPSLDPAEPCSVGGSGAGLAPGAREEVFLQALGVVVPGPLLGASSSVSPCLSPLGPRGQAFTSGIWAPLHWRVRCVPVGAGTWSRTRGMSVAVRRGPRGTWFRYRLLGWTQPGGSVSPTLDVSFGLTGSTVGSLDSFLAGLGQLLEIPEQREKWGGGHVAGV